MDSREAPVIFDHLASAFTRTPKAAGHDCGVTVDANPQLGRLVPCAKERAMRAGRLEAVLAGAH